MNPEAPGSPTDQPAGHDEDSTITQAIGHVILGEEAGAAGTEELDAQGHLRLVRRAVRAERVSRELLGQSVDAARRSGLSWAALGAELGLSRQAVQQRFGARSQETQADPDERWLGPVTVFDELPELELAGRLGWRTVEAATLRHRMVRTDTQWEHRRVVWSAARRHLGEGWQVGCRAFPWVYLVRDTGLPAEQE